MFYTDHSSQLAELWKSLSNLFLPDESARFGDVGSAFPAGDDVPEEVEEVLVFDFWALEEKSADIFGEFLLVVGGGSDDVGDDDE